jgi:hypothetical protein
MHRPLRCRLLWSSTLWCLIKLPTFAHFCHEDAGSMTLRNVCVHPPDYIASERRRQWLRFLRSLECEERKSKCLYRQTFTSWRSTTRSKSWERWSLTSYDVIIRSMTSFGALRALSGRTVPRKVQRSRTIFYQVRIPFGVWVCPCWRTVLQLIQ